MNTLAGLGGVSTSRHRTDGITAGHSTTATREVTCFDPCSTIRRVGLPQLCHNLPHKAKINLKLCQCLLQVCSPSGPNHQNCMHTGIDGQRSPATCASCEGDLTSLTSLLEDGQDPNATNGHFSPLWAAACHGRLKVVKLLLQARADMEIADVEEQRSPLLITAEPQLR